jgi:hypothetical protein
MEVTLGVEDPAAPHFVVLPDLSSLVKARRNEAALSLDGSPRNS